MTLFDDFKKRYLGTYFKKAGGGNEGDTYYKLSRIDWRYFMMIRYYEKTNNIYKKETTLTMDHFNKLEIVDDEAKIQELDNLFAAAEAKKLLIS